jgi:hypothetical protein
LYGSRSHKTKQLLADLREEESKEEEFVTKSMPIPEGRVGALIESMQETQFSEVRWISTFGLTNGSPHWRHRVLWETQFLGLKI